MKQYMLLLLAIFFGCVACDDSDNEINIQPEATGSYTDVRDGNEYHWVRYAGLEWMTENLRFIPDKGVFAPDLTPLPGGYYNDKKKTVLYFTHSIIIASHLSYPSCELFRHSV